MDSLKAEHGKLFFNMFTVFTTFISVLLLFGCSQQTVKKPVVKKTPANTVFFNSFETPKDTANWYWSGEHSFTKDVPPGGGRQSLKVGGGTVLPIGTFLSRPLKYGGYFTVECWGKLMDVGGYIELSTVARHEITESITANVLESDWTYVQSPDTLYCPPNHSLMVSIKTGILLNGSMLLDLIQIKKVGKAKPVLTANAETSNARQSGVINQ